MVDHFSQADRDQLICVFDEGVEQFGGPMKNGYSMSDRQQESLDV